MSRTLDLLRAAYQRAGRDGVGDKVILDVRPNRRDQQGNKIDEQRLWQVLTMRGGRSGPRFS